MKKNLMIVVVVAGIILLIVGGLFLFSRGKTGITSVKITPTPEPVSVEIPAEDLPTVRIIPRADKKEITLEIKEIKNADSIEYELSYLSKGLSRGVVGTIELKGETSITRQILLGTCSKNVCKYDEGVTGGSLLLRLRGASGVTKITADFDLSTSSKGLTLQGWLMK
jgi:hypothetical protein